MSNQSTADIDRQIYRDDYLLVRTHNDEYVSVWVGNPPEESRPTIVNAEDVRDALDEYLRSVDADADQGGDDE